MADRSPAFNPPVNSLPPDNATITQKLIDAGAIILGKTSLTEFANYLTSGMPAGYSSLNGYTFNPYNPVTQPGSDGRPLLSTGGSSAGSGVAMAANFASLAIGTETSGSILSPSNQNSLVGIKPTVGLWSRDGIIPIAASQDTAGPMTRSVTDAAVLLGALTGVDPKDPQTSESVGKAKTDYTPYLKLDALQGVRLGNGLFQRGYILTDFRLRAKDTGDGVST
jgi:amidase